MVKADRKRDLAPSQLRAEILSMVKRVMAEVSAAWTIQDLVDVDRESGWEQLLIEVRVDAPMEYRHALWAKLCDALDATFDTRPRSEQHYRGVIGVSVRPAAQDVVRTA
jgi:hypothetical protein